MLRLQDIMSTDLRTLDSMEPAERAYQCMREWKVHHILIVDGKELLGIVTHRDLGGGKGASVRKDKRVRDLMTDAPICGDARMTVREAARKMRHRYIGALPVLRDGKLVGILTVSDLLDLIGRGVTKPIVRSERRPLSRRAPKTMMGGAR
jgi:acetoin utilization protein AcuB